MISQEFSAGSVQQTPHHAIHQLERNRKELVVLREHLSSYVCEPKTYTLFENCELLKSRLERMQRVNRELIEAVRERKQNIQEILAKSSEQLSALHELERQVLEYIGLARLHN
jgi:nucleoid-associated protein YejK